jgi:hypothetical protein
MKKADNFNPGKWLVENKITFQSRLNEIDREDWGDPRNQPDDEEADLLAASIMKKGAPIPGYKGQTYMNDTLVGEDGEEFGNYRIYNTYEEAVAADGTNIYTLEDKYVVTFSNPESKSEFAGKLNEATEAKAWLVGDEDGLPKIMRFTTVEDAKDAQFDEMADSPYNRPLFTSLEDLKSYLDDQYMRDYDIEKYRYIK